MGLGRSGSTVCQDEIVSPRAVGTAVSVQTRETFVMLAFSYFRFGVFVCSLLSALQLSGDVPAHLGCLCRKAAVVGVRIRKGPVYLCLCCMTILI